MSRAIYLPKFAEVLVALYNTSDESCYCEKLHRKIGITIRHLRNLISDLEDLRFVTRDNSGKIKYIALTESGIELAEDFIKIFPKLRR
ncbi:hypothetical protein ACFL6S_13235 [Candidatus Poribacteria bacterium]